MKPLTLTLALVLFTGLNIFLTFNKHSHAPPYTYHGVLWADRAGYFVHLPALFNAGMDPEQWPQGLDTLTGHGFSVDRSAGTIVTKYTCGVALLQAPFYLIGHTVAAFFDLDRQPFGAVDRAVVSIAGPVYLSLGMLFLFLLFRRRYGDHVTAWTLLGVFAGSNLYFYTIGDPGMSHVHSFFLFSAFLFTVDRTWKGSGHDGISLVLGVLAAMIVLVRPTNFVFIVAVVYATAWAQGVSPIERLRRVGVRGALFFLSPLMMIWSVQLLYWRYAYGSFLTWPYQGEGFTNWNKPELLAFLFSPNNGVLPYTPIILLALGGCLILWSTGHRSWAITIPLVFLAVCYLGSSWWVWHFGCGFGSRTMVEYFALWALPLIALVEWAWGRFGGWLPLSILFILVLMNLKLTYSYDGCWHHGTWDWEVYRSLLFGPTK